jgi:hypothetical protein
LKHRGGRCPIPNRGESQTLDPDVLRTAAGSSPSQSPFKVQPGRSSHAGSRNQSWDIGRMLSRATPKAISEARVAGPPEYRRWTEGGRKVEPTDQFWPSHWRSIRHEECPTCQTRWLSTANPGAGVLPPSRSTKPIDSSLGSKRPARPIVGNHRRPEYGRWQTADGSWIRSKDFGPSVGIDSE